MIDLSIFVGIKDSRRTDKGAIKYKLEHLIFMAIAAILSGMNTWAEIEEWCEYEIEWINNTISHKYKQSPSDDTFRRLFISIEHDKFNKAVREWIIKIGNNSSNCHIVLDGKTAKGSQNKNKDAIHTVHAYARESGLVFSGASSDGKGNEIAGIKELIDSLSLENSIVSIDAMGCQRVICEKIIEKKADYVIAVKGNQGNLFEAVKDEFKLKADEVDWIETVEKQNGGVYKRRYGFLDNNLLAEVKEKWEHIKNVVIENTYKDDKYISSRYFISSLDDIEIISKTVRGHWSIENSLHWVLDVVFRDDNSKCYIDNSAHNFCILRRMCFNMLQLVKTSKDSFRSLRLKFDKKKEFRKMVLNTLQS